MHVNVCTLNSKQSGRNNNHMVLVTTWQQTISTFIKKLLFMNENRTKQQKCFTIACNTYVGFISFFVFHFLVTLTKKRKNQLSFSGKVWICYTENKQTGQLIFLILVTDQKTKNGMNRTII